MGAKSSRQITSSSPRLPNMSAEVVVENGKKLNGNSNNDRSCNFYTLYSDAMYYRVNRAKS